MFQAEEKQTNKEFLKMLACKMCVNANVEQGTGIGRITRSREKKRSVQWEFWLSLTSQKQRVGSVRTVAVTKPKGVFENKKCSTVWAEFLT